MSFLFGVLSYMFIGPGYPQNGRTSRVQLESHGTWDWTWFHIGYFGFIAVNPKYECAKIPFLSKFKRVGNGGV